MQDAVGVSMNQPGLNAEDAPLWIIDSLAALGVRHVRLALPWNTIEPSQGRFDWSRSDRVLRAAIEARMEVTAYLAHTPGWASSTRTGVRGADTTKAMPPDSSAWVDFVRAALSHYDGFVRSWEIWNEPSWGYLRSGARTRTCSEGNWCGTAAEYARLFASSAAVIRATDPTLQVAIGGLVLNARGFVFFREVMRSLPDSLLPDVISFHHYGSTAELVEKVDAIRSVIEGRRRPAALWLTETGHGDAAAPLSLRGYASPSGQARYLRETLVTAHDVGVDRVYWFKGFDTEGANPRFAHHGLFDASLRPKQVVGELAHAIRTCDTRLLRE